MGQAIGFSGPTSRNLKRPSRARRRGAAVVELAVVSPLLCILALGAVEYSQLAHTSQVIGNASRRGARIASRTETSSVATIQQNVRDFVTSNLPNLASGASVSVNVQNGSGGALSDGTLTAMSAGSPVVVDVSLSFSTVRWLNYFSGLNGQTLQATTMARRE